MRESMKVITILSLLLLASPTFGELTKEDVRQIMREEVRTIVKEEIAASEKRMREYVDLKLQVTNTKIDELAKRLNTKIEATNIKIDGLDERLNIRIDESDKRFGDMWTVVIALIGMITAAVAIPQLIIAYKERGQKEVKAEIERLRQEVEVLKQSRIVKP